MIRARECGILSSNWRRRRCDLSEQDKSEVKMKMSKIDCFLQSENIHNERTSNNKLLTEFNDLTTHGIHRPQIGGFSPAQCVMLANR